MNDAVSGSKCGHKHPENEDHYGVRKFPGGCLIVVADGRSSRPFSGSFARWLVHRFMNDSFSSFTFEEYLSKLHLEFQADFEDFPEMLASGVCIALVVVSSSQAVGYWAGDCAIFHTSLSGQPETNQISDPYVAGPGVLKKCFNGSEPFRAEKRPFELESGDVVCVVSDGVIVDAADLTQGLTQVAGRQAFVDNLLEMSNRGPLSDDATMVCYTHS